MSSVNCFHGYHAKQSSSPLAERRPLIPNTVLETRDLRLVHAIAEADGATRAAVLLSVSQSAVSHQLRNLEERLGVVLFERRGRKLRITPAGERLVQLSRDVLLPLSLAELELRRGAARHRPKLRLATQCYTAYDWLPRALSALVSRHPEVDLVIAQDVSGDVATALREHRLDVALCVDPPTGRTLERKVLFQDELVLGVARGHELARRPYVLGRDLRSLTLIQSTVDPSQRERIRKLLFRDGESFGRVVRVPVTDAILELIGAGMGVGILPEYALRPRKLRFELETVRLTEKGLRRTWSAVFERKSALAGPIATLLAALAGNGANGR